MRRLAAEYAKRRQVAQGTPFITVAEALDQWLAADHDWRPSTWASYWSNARALRADPVGGIRVAALDSAPAKACINAWQAIGSIPAVISGRFRTLRASLGWAYGERLIERNPLESMRGPPQPGPRTHVRNEEVLRLLRFAERRVCRSSETTGSPERHRAEQALLLIRLSADAGARRGELAALRTTDLDGRVLTISQAVSLDEIGPTKSGRLRRLTLGSETARLWHQLVATWAARRPMDEPLGSWLFSAGERHDSRASTSLLTQLFDETLQAAGVPQVSLHQLRHSVATFLVDKGHLLKAQQRLGHHDAATTLRCYAHAVPLEDQDAADAIDALLARPVGGVLDG